MKKFIILAISISLFNVSLFAQTTANANLNLSGVVLPINSVTITPAAAASNLDLSVAVTNLAVASVVERSNRHVGYTLTLSSANAGALVGSTAGNTDSLAYSLQYNGSPVTLVGGAATLTNANGRTTGAGVTKSLNITYDGAAVFLSEDTYTDTLTLTITAK